MRTTKTKTDEMELLFRALADPTRLRLLNLMGDDEICVCYLVEALNLSQPKISRHLAYLRRAGVVVTRREGKWMHYRVVTPDNPHAAVIFREIRAWLANDKGMRSDRQRLVGMCCSPKPPPQLRRAPKPAPAENTQP
jgi:ArsR family transcriptional regulator, arsenate/arsenite/antimonite-responsive transcriptional repressor